jgi:hypothetical protein
MTDDSTGTFELGFKGHETEQMQRLARLSFKEKLAWLEEAHCFVLEMQKARAAAAVEKKPTKAQLSSNQNRADK